MLVSFDNKFVRRDQKQRRIDEPCQASPTCSDVFPVDYDKFDIKRHLVYMSFYLSCIKQDFKMKRDSNK